MLKEVRQCDNSGAYRNVAKYIIKIYTASDKADEEDQELHRTEVDLAPDALRRFKTQIHRFCNATTIREERKAKKAEAETG